MKASEVLMKAKALIGTPDKWMKREAMSSDGKRMCMWGALTKASFGECGMSVFNNEPEWAALVASCPEMPAIFNDKETTTHGMVMDAFDRAIALALADERKQEPWTIEKTREVIERITAQPVEA